MSRISERENGFVAYEYKEILVNRSMESMYVDGYENFGWELMDTSRPMQTLSTVALKFKRNRKILNKAELTRLQRQFDAQMKEILQLERSKTTTASIVAYTIGLIGTAFMAGSVFAITSDMVVACILLALPAFIACGLSYVSYKKISRKKTTQMDELIESKYDEVYETCQKGNGLLV